MATSAQVEEFRAANAALVALAHRDLLDFWAALNLEQPDLARDALLEFFPDLLVAYADTSAVLGADWYDMLRDAPPSAARFRAALAAPPALEQAQGALRWALGPLFEDDADLALKQLLGSTQRLVLQPGRESTWNAARTDPIARSFARVPSGMTTCQWCVMLASRGFDYNTAESAGQGIRFHDNCDCVIVPGNDRSDLPEDYDLDYYVDLYTSGLGISQPA